MPVEVVPMNLSGWSDVERWQRELRAKGVAETTIHEYETVIHRLLEASDKLNLSLPQSWTIEDVGAVLDAHGRVNWHHRVLKIYLKFLGNDVLQKYKILIPKHQHVGRWLTTPQVKTLLRESQVPTERMVVHLMVLLGLRRVDVLRLRIDDIDMNRNRIRVRGKGYRDGKERDIPFNPWTKETFKIYFQYRDLQKQLIEATHPGMGIEDSGQLIIYRSKNQLKGYKRSSIDLIIKRISKRCGFDFSAHDLRRTFGRLMYDETKNVATVSYALGHSNTETTIRYLGINFDDVQNGLAKVTDALSSLGPQQSHINNEVIDNGRNVSESAENGR